MEFEVCWEWLNRPLQVLIYNEACSCICTIYYNGQATVMMIDNVNTKEEYSNQGYATRLMGKAVEMAHHNNVDSIELNVNRNNTIAKHIYEKLGFELTDKDYYRMLLNKWTT